MTAHVHAQQDEARTSVWGYLLPVRLVLVTTAAFAAPGTEVTVLFYFRGPEQSQQPEIEDQVAKIIVAPSTDAVNRLLLLET